MKNRFWQPVIWLVMLCVFSLIFVQITGASPFKQDGDTPPPGTEFPELGQSGAPIVPIFIDRAARDVDNELNGSAETQISVWYGANQNFGQNGNPQGKVDILGNVQTLGSAIQYIRYRLNSSAPGDYVTIKVGSDSRRLYRDGDFHIELDISDLVDGVNTVDIVAKGVDEVEVGTQVIVNYDAGNSWPKNYTADWASRNNPQDIAQVVDGYWVIENDRLQLTNDAIGYDRLVAIGEFDEWDDYEATIPVTIRGIDPDGFKKPSSGAGVGAIIRWQGYEQLASEQPASGWQERVGAIAWNRYKIDNDLQVSQGLQMIGSSAFNSANNVLAENPNIQLEFNKTYIFKVSVQTVNNAGDIYRFKVWPEGQPEPYGWDIVAQGTFANEPQTGSLALISHHVDVEFGNVVVVPTSSKQFSLTVGKDGDGAVPVASPNQATYSYGQEVTITSSPDIPGSVLGRWEGDAGGRSDPLTLKMTGNANVTAVYVPSVTGGLSVSTTGGNGQVNVTPAKAQYYFGEEVVVNAIPDAGYSFVNWQTSTSVNTQSINDSALNPYSFIFGQDATSVTAVFAEKPTYNLTTGTTGSGSGSILKNPDKSSFPEGSLVELTAQADAGSQWTDWGDPYSGQTNPFYVLMTANKTVQAQFDQVGETFSLTVNSGPNGKVTAVPDKAEYLYGELVVLTAVGNPGYMLGSWGGDLAGNENPIAFGMFDDYSISATFVEEMNPVSDDFNRCKLNNGQWTVSDPLGDSRFNMTGAKLEIALPAGTAHDVYQGNNTSPRVLTPADDEANLSLLVKFDSPMNKQYQSMGIIVQEADNKLLRFDFYHDGGKTNIHAASLVDGGFSQKIKKAIADGSPLFLRINRNGNSWSQFYSYDGINFVKAGTFVFDMKVTEAGLFAGNPGPAPAFKAEFDYFFNSANPIVPQDTNKNTISVGEVGEGTVTVKEEKENYACGEVVTFEAEPAEGWYFITWSGDLSGQTNPNRLTVSGSHQVKAIFSTSASGLNSYLPIVIRPK